MEISREKLKELTEITEDTVQYFCDTHQASGQLVWTCIEALAITKLAELDGQLASVSS